MDRISDYLKHIEKRKDDRCNFCGKSLDELKNEFLKCKELNEEEYEDLTVDDISLISYKFKKPVCAGCYFDIKNNSDLVKNILKSHPHDIWE